MAVLNKDEFYYLNTSGFWSSAPPVKEKRPDTYFWNFRKFDDYDCYYFEFKHGDAFHAFPIETLISEDALRAIKNREVMLVVCNSHEAFHNVVDGLYRTLVLASQIPPEQIILMSESADIHIEIQRVSKMYGFGEIKAEWVRVFEADVRIQKVLMNEANHFLSTLEDKIYTKKYINFNRRWRPHRPALVSMLLANNLIDYGYVSLGDADDRKNWNIVWPALFHYHRNNTEIINLLENNKDRILNLPPLYIDTDNLIQNKAFLETTTDYLYKETYFSVVSETNYYTTESCEPGRFLSEKTFKPIAQQHPFIIVSVPNILKTLRSLGYKTFHPWIDESYDDEVDDSLRMLKIIAEIKRLCELSPSDLSEFLRNVREICEFNSKLLMSKDTFFNRLN
jgi:hypothetical protein